MAPPKKDRYVATVIVTVEPGQKHSSRTIKGALAFDPIDGAEVTLKSVKPLEAPAPKPKAEPKAPAKKKAKKKA